MLTCRSRRDNNFPLVEFAFLLYRHTKCNLCLDIATALCGFSTSMFLIFSSILSTWYLLPLLIFLHVLQISNKSTGIKQRADALSGCTCIKMRFTRFLRRTLYTKTADISSHEEFFIDLICASAALIFT